MKRRPDEPREKSKLARRLSLLAGAVGVLAAILVFRGFHARSSLSSSVHSVETRPASPEVAPANNSATSESTWYEEIEPGVYVERDTPGSDDPKRLDVVREQFRESYRNYLEYTKYPPWSRPFDGSKQHLLDWDSGTGIEQEIAQDENDNDIFARAELTRAFAGPGETLTATVTVWRVGANNERQPVPFEVRGEIRMYQENVTAESDAPIHANWGVVHRDVVFQPDPGDPMRQVAVFAPSDIPALHPGPNEVMLVAWVAANGGLKPFNLPFHYTVEPAFQVVGKVADRLKNGSLEVEFKARNLLLQRVRFTAILSDSKGEKHIATFHDWLPAPTKVDDNVTITFYGRSINEMGIDGPYTVSAHAFVEVNGLPSFWKSNTVFTTKAYRSRDFTRDEWTDPEKAETLAAFEGLIQTGGR